MSPQHLYFRRRHLWWRSIFWWWRLLSVTIAHMKLWWSLSVTINHYWWRTLNVTTTPILSATPPLVMFNFLVMEAIVRHHCSYEMVTITIRHYKSLLVSDLECHHNTYTFTAPPLVTLSFWWWRVFWPSPMSLWWPFLPLSNVIFFCSVIFNLM